MIFGVKNYPYLCDDDEYEKCHPYTERLMPGVYFFQAWGAQGGGIQSTKTMGGKGGYASGILSILRPTYIYIYVGHYGSSYREENPTDNKYAYNCGGKPRGSGGGGGATDFRLVKGEHNETTSLKSRILIAGGGGGSDYKSKALMGGVGGGLKGGDADGEAGKGGTQEKGGEHGVNQDNSKDGQNLDGNLGMGGSTMCDTAGGGGGYYGGGSGACIDTGNGGGGGSGYVSGHPECTIHPSNLVFKNPMLFDGNQSFPTITDTLFTKMEIGHALNGHAKITLLSHLYINSCLKYHSIRFYSFLLYIIFLQNYREKEQISIRI